MKKFVLGAIAALVATISIAPTAEAGWYYYGHRGWHGGVYFAPRVVIRPAPVVVYSDYCYVKKIRRYDAWGNVYIRRVRVCG